MIREGLFKENSAYKSIESLLVFKKLTKYQKQKFGVICPYVNKM